MLLPENDSWLSREASATRNTHSSRREGSRERESQPLALTRSFFEAIHPIP